MRGTPLTIGYFNNRLVKRLSVVESGCTDLTSSCIWETEYQRWKTSVTPVCFAKAGVYVLLGIEAANVPPSCLPVTKDENGRLGKFEQETGVKTRLNACFAQDFVIMRMMNVPFRRDRMVTRKVLMFGPPRLDPSSPRTMSEATISRWKAIPMERPSQPSTPPRNLKVPHLPSV